MDYVEAGRSAAAILREYELCDQCLGRLFSKRMRLSSNRMLGRRLRRRAASGCHVCRGMFDDLGHYLGLMERASAGYEFSSFMVGCRVRPSIVDRDDQIRSRYRMRGVDGIKTDVSRELARRFARRSGARADPLRPELTLVVDIKGRSCEARARQVVVSGRYVKTQRGIPQRQGPCKECSGDGCAACSWHGISGYGSVQGAISEYLFGRLGGTTARFTWVGGEDASSLVLGSGRPFFARIQDPRRRLLGAKSKALGAVRLGCLRMVPEPPRGPLRFVSEIRMRVSVGPGSWDPRGLRALAGRRVAVYERSGRRAEKTIHSITYRRRGDRLDIGIRADGGLPVKRFVSGDEVSPSVSKAVGAPCECVEFDFEGVRLQTIN